VDRASAIGIADLDGDSEPEMIIGTYNEAYGVKSEFRIYSDDLESLTTTSELTPIFTQILDDQTMGVESFKFHDFDANVTHQKMFWKHIVTKLFQVLLILMMVII
jgi:hypothetical protein